ncbi:MULTISPECIES: Na+/H+ antiporter subunit C [unclassified Sphingomonas]|uniref:Na+/H+ antiporter subunit C n=1 Tax=unclassified Sphingomonas TaxID=196159 RepID=UPI001D114509|nr:MULTISPECIES: Na+/H+ antiporter subunit C [unclassified Sphingomonas]MCC2979488.1 Na+/H+ antiporter subunit C [Sphingomonas sp. IC4-52]MCD2315283.1 Na+/H+ antiporter subunit C [Sphingomonas sp. IC-11]
MEIVLAIGIGVLTASGVWLILRPRTFQVILGLSLASYAVNLFIYAMGRLKVDAPPIVGSGTPNPTHFDDPLPQALVLTAIVISFAMTALLLVVLLASRGLTGTDHVDGEEDE